MQELVPMHGKRNHENCLRVPSSWTDGGCCRCRWCWWRIGTGCGESDIPDIGLSAEVQRPNDVSVVNSLITSQYHGLIRIKRGDPRERRKKLVGGHAPTVHDQTAIGFHIDDDFSDGAALFFRFTRRGHLDIKLPFLTSKTPREHEESEQHEKDIDHRGDQETPWLRL